MLRHLVVLFLHKISIVNNYLIIIIYMILGGVLQTVELVWTDEVK